MATILLEFWSFRTIDTKLAVWVFFGSLITILKSELENSKSGVRIAKFEMALTFSDPSPLVTYCYIMCPPPPVKVTSQISTPFTPLIVRFKKIENGFVQIYMEHSTKVRSRSGCDISDLLLNFLYESICRKTCTHFFLDFFLLLAFKKSLKKIRLAKIRKNSNKSNWKKKFATHLRINKQKSSS